MLSLYSALASIITALALGAATSVAAGGSPEQQCQASKNKAAGAYATCRQSAEAKLATTGDATRYGEALTKCAAKLSRVWQKVIDKATAASAACLDDQLTVGDFEGVINAHTDNIATALEGGALGIDVSQCQNELIQCQNDLAACEGGVAPGELLETGQTGCWDSGGTPIACAGTGQDGELQRGLARAYVDNGDGTITDTRTGLIWEKLSDDGSIHDRDTTYTWDGAFNMKVAALNSGVGFAGHTDWRLPNRFELESLVNLETYNPAVYLAFNTACALGCTVLTCSCTDWSNYWSATTNAGTPDSAWNVDFYDGYTGDGYKGDHYAVRAVRGGS